MRSLTSALVMFCLFGLGINTALAWNANAVKNCNITIGEFKKKDKKLDNFFTQAYGYAVFPSVGKGAIGIGGAHGNGVVYEKGKPIGDTSLTQITIGFQLGGQAYSEIIFFKDKKTLDDFKNGNFELGAQASAVAVTAGASADANYEKGVAVFTMAKGGLMYEASVG
ncbi:MAG: lipid-binding SYLF domain-containing protein, partial [Proteobacteria bacterium]|nr:lipid-binding SYLF domain-containing protein [Pseudomonadota bacterium]